ncbi:unnamed protein product [Sphenostylis stenocarpa]|uniref:mannan endo-1,4-beta-mannosidase n=1 Tax=Sphenostylis stenocarpa TaxID=92480 RepID=A0AA86V6Q8_9FABA|nr:unnamed protein product [Sphenostylis stenocarpa]
MGFENLVVMTFMMTLFISEYGNCKHIVHPLNNSNINLVGQRRSGSGFIQRHGTHFLLNGRPHYFNGFNAYWLMAFASDLSLSYKVTKVFQEASKHGLNVARTWAFNDAGYMPLQISPGFYDENVFRGLDFVISEAGKYGIHLILRLVNNWKDNGGKNHYVEWARERGQRLSKDDDFFSNPITKRFYKNHVKAVLRRKNTITGVLYKNDPTIFAWELMNEPRSSDLSGQQIQEMAGYVKYIDNNHLLQIGLEGFYGESQAGRKQFNPGYEAGTDFIANNLSLGCLLKLQDTPLLKGIIFMQNYTIGYTTALATGEHVQVVFSGNYWPKEWITMLMVMKLFFKRLPQLLISSLNNLSRCHILDASIT